MANTYTAIATTTVGAGGASSIDIQNIPNTYNDLLLVLSLRGSTNSWNSHRLYFNNSNSSLSYVYLLGDGANASASSGANGYIGTIGGTNTTTNTFSSSCIYIPNYTSSYNKSYAVENVAENNATTGYLAVVAGMWTSSSVINRITIVSDGAANWVQYSSATLYGISNT